MGGPSSGLKFLWKNPPEGATRSPQESDHAAADKQAANLEQPDRLASLEAEAKGRRATGEGLSLGRIRDIKCMISLLMPNFSSQIF